MSTPKPAIRYHTLALRNFKESQGNYPQCNFKTNSRAPKICNVTEDGCQRGVDGVASSEGRLHPASMFRDGASVMTSADLMQGLVECGYKRMKEATDVQNTRLLGIPSKIMSALSRQAVK